MVQSDLVLRITSMLWSFRVVKRVTLNSLPALRRALARIAAEETPSAS